MTLEEFLEKIEIIKEHINWNVNINKFDLVFELIDLENDYPKQTIFEIHHLITNANEGRIYLKER